MGANGEQCGAKGINGFSLSHFCGAAFPPIHNTPPHAQTLQWVSSSQPISHLRGAMLKDVRLNRRHVRVDLVGRAKLVRGLIRRKREEGRRKKEKGEGNVRSKK